MIATRTLPSSILALPFVAATGSSRKLLADVQDALDDREPGGRRQRDDRPGKAATWREDETGGDEHDALRTRAQADVAAQSKCHFARAGIGNEEGNHDLRDRGSRTSTT